MESENCGELFIGERTFECQYSSKKQSTFKDDESLQLALWHRKIEKQNIVVDLQKEIEIQHKVTPNTDFLSRLHDRIWLNNKLEVNDIIFKKARHFVENVVEECMQIEPTFKVNIINSGSYASNIRVGLPYEFDFMLDISPMLRRSSESPSSCESGEHGYTVVPMCQDENCKSEYLYKVFADTECVFTEQRDHITEKFPITASHVRSVLFNLFHTAVKTLENELGEHFECRDDESISPAFPVAFATEIEEVGAVGVMIDFVPCLKIPTDERNNPDDILPKLKKNVVKFYEARTKRNAIEAICEKLYLVCYKSHENVGDINLFRLSTSVLEGNIFCNTDPVVLKPIRLAKYFFQLYPIKDAIAPHKWTKPDYLYFANSRGSPLFGFKSDVMSYMVTNLFLHILTSGQACFLMNRSDGEIFMLFMKLALVSFWPTVPFFMTHDPDFDIDRIYISFYGWCFEKTNTIATSTGFSFTVYQAFKKCFAGWVQLVLQSAPDDFENFPLLISESSNKVCKGCFIDNIKYMHTLAYAFNVCPIHKLLGTDFVDLPFGLSDETYNPKVYPFRECDFPPPNASSGKASLTDKELLDITRNRIYLSVRLDETPLHNKILVYQRAESEILYPVRKCNLRGISARNISSSRASSTDRVLVYCRPSKNQIPKCVDETGLRDETYNPEVYPFRECNIPLLPPPNASSDRASSTKKSTGLQLYK